MLSKRRIINTLFVLSFPLFGIGNFISASASPSLGYIVSIIIPFIILIFYTIDLLYQKEFEVRINSNFILINIFLLSAVVALHSSFSRGLPDMSLNVVIFKSLLIIVPFYAFIVVNIYNRESESELLARNIFIALSILLLANLIGYYGLGMSNQVHQLEGRINFPFLSGLYEGANMLTIISLMLLFYLTKYPGDPILKSLGFIYFVGTLVLIFFINSRVCIMMLSFVLMLFLFGAVRRWKTIFTFSIFTIPILLSSGLLIYQIMQLPPFISVLQRVELIDVVTFNGRAFLWQNALDWLIEDRRGFFFGNGFSGQYFIDLVSDVARLWNEEDTYSMHLHSTSLEIMINQGVVMLVIFIVLAYRTFRYYHNAYTNDLQGASFFLVMIFLVFLLHVDTFLYLGSLGFFIWSMLLSRIVLDDTGKELAQIKP